MVKPVSHSCWFHRSANDFHHGHFHHAPRDCATLASKVVIHIRQIIVAASKMAGSNLQKPQLGLQRLNRRRKHRLERCSAEILRGRGPWACARPFRNRRRRRKWAIYHMWRIVREITEKGYQCTADFEPLGCLATMYGDSHPRKWWGMLITASLP